MELAKAYVQVIPSADGMQGNIESQLTGQLSGIGDKSGKNFGSSFLKVGAGVIAAGTAAVTAAAAGVWKAANATAEMGDEIDKTSQKMGVSASQYQAMAFAAEHCGFEVGTFQTAAKKLADTEFDGSVYDAMEAIMALDDETQRAAMAEELFGTKVAQQMAPLLNGTQSLEDYKGELAEIGGLMSDETVAASAAFEDSLTNLKTSFSGLSNGLMAEFLPTITTVMDGITKLINGDDSGLAMIKDGISQFLSNLEGMIPELINIAMNLMDSFLNVIIENLPEIIQMGIEIILKLIIGIVKAIPDLVAKVPEIIMAIVTAFKNELPSMVSTGKYLVEGLWNGILKAKDWIKNKLKEWVGDVMSFLKDLFGIASPSKLMRDEIGKWIPEGIAVGIDANTRSVEDAMSSLAATTVSAAKFDFERSSVPGEVAAAGSGTVINQTLNVTTTDNSPDEIARTIRLESRYGLMIGGALG